MEVVKGQIAVLHAWYSPSSDISKNSVTWQFNTNGSKPVRKHLLRIKLFPEQGLNLSMEGLLLKSESPIVKIIRWKPAGFIQSFGHKYPGSPALTCLM